MVSREKLISNAKTAIIYSNWIVEFLQNTIKRREKDTRYQSFIDIGGSKISNKQINQTISYLKFIEKSLLEMIEELKKE